MRRLILLSLLLSTAVFHASGTHIRAADIKVEPICGTPLTYRITVIAYLNTLSNTRFGTSSQIFFGDGQSVRIPIMSTTMRPDLGNNIGIASFSTVHTYASPGKYEISYLERDRSTGVLNIERSEDVPYVTNVTVDLSTKFGCNNLPVLAVPPIDRACHQSTFYHTSGAYDVDGDSLSYDLYIPLQSPTQFAPYTPPTNAKYYLDPSRGNELKSGPATFTINQLDGLLTWDAPGLIGEYNIAFRVHEWRKDAATGKYEEISTTTRDMQIIVEECQNFRPYLRISNDTCVVAGSYVFANARGFDDDKHDVKIEVFSELIDMSAAEGPANYVPRPSAFVTSVPFAMTQLTWNTTCAHIRQQPYQVVFKITDSPPRGPKLVNFKVWNVRVIAPAPVQQPPNLDLVKRSAALSWDPYSCENVSKVQVWRKVGSFASAQNYCDIRSPGYWGYKLIAELPPTATAFTDDNFGKGLSVGAKYCYRIVGAFPDTRGYPSQEFCVGPIEADAPVITHVSVDRTAESGKMRVSWRKPFGINKTQFPEPYEYDIYRADGFIGETNIGVAGRVMDTTFLDQSINTEAIPFNYRIVLYGKPQNASAIVAIDTSDVASSVRLSVKPGEGLIELTWRDSVPWSNVVDTNPWHRIYRSVDNPKESAMVLIDSVNVTLEGFKYTDRGAYKSTPIAEDGYYSYRVLTRGTYGNPQIKLQQNYSQMVSTYPINDLLPCSPVLQVSILDCEQYVVSDNCAQTEFSNQIYWSAFDLKGCRRDIKYYNVYGSATRGGDYNLLATQVIDTFYVDSKLPSFARCYRVAAVDKMGVESQLSDSVCNNNCPSYMLPNVFSPNGDGHNDTFHARFKAGSLPGESTCPRFVQSVDLRVYDRWGKQIYRRRLDTEETAIEFEWDGLNDKGEEVPAGVYYYSADVSFEMLDEEAAENKYKGWVQIVR